MRGSGHAPRGGRAPGEAGQASIELLATLPLLLLVALAAAQVLALGVARTAAGTAAQAAAMALLQGADPRAAAHAATPDWAHDRLQVTVSGRHVRIRLTPPTLLPGTTSLLTSAAEADAGPPSP